MDKQTVFKVFCVALPLLLIALIIEKRNPVTTLPIDYIINDEKTERSSEFLDESKEVTVYVSDLNGIIFPITVDVKGAKSVYKDDIELTFSMLTEYSNYLPMGVKTIVPPSTRLINYELNDHRLVLNVSKEFMNYNNKDLGDMKDILTYSFTQTNNQIESVSILCEGNTIESISQENFLNLNRNSRLLNTIFEADHISDSKTVKVYYYTSTSSDEYLVPVNIIVKNDQTSNDIIIDEILTSYYINIPVTSYVNEKNIITVNEQLSNIKSGYTNIEDDLSLKQYYYTLVANNKEVKGVEIEDYNTYSVELR